MATPVRQLETGKVYHVYNRGVEKRTTFTDTDEHQHFLRTLAYYQQSAVVRRLSNAADFALAERKLPFRFDILTYCLMPNHFHLLLKQNEDGGIREGLSLILNSYTKAFNTKHKRVGPLFQGRFQSVEIEDDEQLVHTARYIHLNPYVASLETELGVYPWSSWKEYFSKADRSISQPHMIQDYFLEAGSLLAFMTDHADYARTLSRLKHTFDD